MYAKPKYLNWHIFTGGQEMADEVRKRFRGKDVLFHGTPYADACFISGSLRCSRIGQPFISLSRDAHVAAYWATLPRDDEGRKAILVFDRERLAANYRTCPVHYPDTSIEGIIQDEMEEVVVGRDIVNFQRLLSGVVWLGAPPPIQRPVLAYDWVHV